MVGACVACLRWLATYLLVVERPRLRRGVFTEKLSVPRPPLVYVGRRHRESSGLGLAHFRKRLEGSGVLPGEGHGLPPYVANAREAFVCMAQVALCPAQGLLTPLSYVAGAYCQPLQAGKDFCGTAERLIQLGHFRNQLAGSRQHKDVVRGHTVSLNALATGASFCAKPVPWCRLSASDVSFLLEERFLRSPGGPVLGRHV